MGRIKPNITLPMKNRNTIFRHAKTEGVSTTKYMGKKDSKAQRINRKMKDKKYANIQELRQISKMIALEKPENLKVIADIIAAYQIGGLKVVAQYISETIKLSEINADKIIKDRFEQVKSAENEIGPIYRESGGLPHRVGGSEYPNNTIIKFKGRFRRTKINSLYKN